MFRLSKLLTLIVIFGFSIGAEAITCNQIGISSQNIAIDKQQVFSYFSKKASLRNNDKWGLLVHTYKNLLNNSEPKTLDLDGPDLRVASLELLSYSDTHFDPNSGAEFPEHLTQYAKAVIFLQKGDFIKTKQGTFRLGDFLGAGSTTHIFRLADDPKKVIRIPLSVIGDSGLLWVSQFINRYEDGKIPRSVPHVRIYSPTNQLDYIVTDYVRSNLAGADFTKRMENTHQPSQYDKIRLKRLEQLVKISNTNARQFIWDLDRKDWILIDW